MEYTIHICWIEEFSQYGLLIINDRTGEYLTMRKYEEWIQHIGGFEK